MVGFHGPEAISLRVADPELGRLATVRLDPEQAAALAGRLSTMLLDRATAEPRLAED